MKLVVAVTACLVIAADLSAQGAQLPIVGTWRTGPVAGGGDLQVTFTQSGDTLTVHHAVVDSAGKPGPTTTALYIIGSPWVSPDNAIRTSISAGMGGRFFELSSTTTVPTADGPSLINETFMFLAGKLTRKVSQVIDGRITGARSDAWTRVAKP